MAPINGDNYSVSKNIYDLLNIVESSCRIAKQHGASAEVFLYPVITSRSFSEMKMRLQKVVDVLLTQPVKEDESTEDQKATPLQKIRRIFGGRR